MKVELPLLELNNGYIRAIGNDSPFHFMGLRVFAFHFLGTTINRPHIKIYQPIVDYIVERRDVVCTLELVYFCSLTCLLDLVAECCDFVTDFVGKSEILFLTCSLTLFNEVENFGGNFRL